MPAYPVASLVARVALAIFPYGADPSTGTTRRTMFFDAPTGIPTSLDSCTSFGPAIGEGTNGQVRHNVPYDTYVSDPMHGRLAPADEL